MYKKFKIFIILFLIFLLPCVNAAKIKENSYMVINAKDNSVLIERNANVKVYPASTTKILTCILALENLNLEETITVTQEMLSELPKGSSTMKLKAGNKLTVDELLHGLMIPSGNDAAIVVAHLVSGSTEEFSKLMNKKMKEIGATNTNFVNPHGFHNEDHYTTAKDMSKLMSYAIKNEKFIEIISTKKFVINNESIDRTYTNTNILLGTLEYDIIGKTGYTSEAGNVFISYSKNNDIELITILLDGDSNYYNYKYRFDDTVYLNEYIFDNYTYNTVIPSNVIKLQLINKNDGANCIYTNQNDLQTLTNIANKNTNVEYSLENIFSNEPTIKINLIGNNYYLNNYELKLNIYNSNTVSKDSTLDFKIILIILLELLTILILLICIYKIYLLLKPKKKKRIKKKYY